jgi:hypothetical protein
MGEDSSGETGGRLFKRSTGLPVGIGIALGQLGFGDRLLELIP